MITVTTTHRIDLWPQQDIRWRHCSAQELQFVILQYWLQKTDLLNTSGGGPRGSHFRVVAMFVDVTEHAHHLPKHLAQFLALNTPLLVRGRAN